MQPDVTPAHTQAVTNRYVLSYPAHLPRANDPHYAAFNAYHRAHRDTGRCYVGLRVGFDQCATAVGQIGSAIPVAGGAQPGLELHHGILEMATLNSVDLAAIQVDYPALTSLEDVLTWAETEVNLMWICARHHRGSGGVHHAAAADWSAELYIRGLVK